MPNTILKEALNERLFVTIKNNLAHLKENDSSAELNDIKIERVSPIAVLLNCDKIKTDNLFKKGLGQNMRCDFLLLSENIAYFIELKTHERAEEKYREDCIKKFKAVECITEYIDSVLVRFYQRERLFAAFEKRYILFYKAPSISKFQTSIKPQNKPCNDNPQNMLAIPISNSSIVDISKLRI